MKVSRAIRILIGVIFFAVFFLALSFSFIEKFLFESWSELLPDEIIYHILAPLEGTDNTLIITALVRYGFLTIVILVGFIFLFRIIKGETKPKVSFLALMLAFSVFITGVAILDADNQSGIVYYLKSAANYDPEGDFIFSNYIEPTEVSITFPEKKRNLIYIFLESVETTFADKDSGGAFDKNVIRELTRLSKNNEDFRGDEGGINGAYTLPGANWTAGAMFAHTAGIPVKVVLDGNDFLEGDTFFPGITTLGDVLEKEGYKNTIIMGSDAKFGGRNALFGGHGNFALHDYYYMLETEKLPADYNVYWGYEDAKLFEFAKEDLAEIGKTDEPFCYTMLTVDTHFEDGYPCLDCGDEFDDKYSNVFACSSKKVNDFISWVKRQDFYENTTIVIAGDHTTMDRDYCDNVDANYPRKVFYTIINDAPAEKLSENRREYTILDSFPTTLAALGATIEGNQLGLGVNLYSDKETYAEKLGIEGLRTRLSGPSTFFEKRGEETFDESSLEIIANNCSIRWDTMPDGSLKFRLRGINAVNFDEVSDGTLTLISDEGQKHSYELKVIKYNENSRSGYLMEALTDVTFNEAKNWKVEAYVPVKDFPEYLMATSGINEENHADLSKY